MAELFSMEHPKRRHMDILEDLLPLEGSKLLDIGCGRGDLLRALSKKGAKACGLEVSQARLAQAQALPKVGDESYHLGLGQDLPFADESFDIAIFFNSLHHVPSEVMGAALREAWRVLKPEGLLYVGEPVSHGPFHEAFKVLDDETEVQAEAQRQVQAVLHAGLYELVAHTTYLSSFRYVDFESCMEEIVAIDPERRSLAEQHWAELAIAFEAAGEKDDKGYRFWMPLQARLLRKTG